MKQDVKLCVGVIAGIVGVASVGGVARATVVEYTPGSPFAWTPQTFNPFPPPIPTPPNAMDITQPPSQSGAITPTSVYQTFANPATSSGTVDLVWTSGGSVMFAVTPIPSFSSWHRPGLPSSPLSYSAPRQYLDGQTIDGGATYASSVTVGWTNGFLPFARDYDYIQFTPPSTITHINLANPDDMVVGLKLNISGQDYFGWMAVHWVTQGRGRYDITKWAYETTPNTPITVPAPGVGGLAAVGLLTALRRRRR